ncbi:hypothetical protein OH77DRAFT_103493 [Trametes cingulata]|nr:hypothetical protein OH77DRAFT_103493 [Trametes cingulata]
MRKCVFMGTYAGGSELASHWCITIGHSVTCTSPLRRSSGYSVVSRWIRSMAHPSRGLTRSQMRSRSYRVSRR